MFGYFISVCMIIYETSLVAFWLEFLTTNHEAKVSIPGCTICVFP